MASSDADSGDSDVLRSAQAGRKHFLALVAQVRPELHRYCARMTGSVADGEDVVQDTLARAWFELADLRELPPLRPWLFRIAHNRAIDWLRAAKYRQTEPLDDETTGLAADERHEPEQALQRADTVRLAVARFMQLPATQRSCVILKDVLEYSLDDIAALLGISLAATKAALHRGRARLDALQHQAASHQPIPLPARVLPGLHARYAALFNARDWDGVRALLLDDVKLDLVDHLRAQGEQAMHYFSNYDRISGWRLTAGWLDGQPALAVFTAASGQQPGYFIQLTLAVERISAIRDFRYVPYIAHDAVFEPAASAG